MTADLDVIGSNEVAAQAFRRFCGNPACEFFQAGVPNTSSYGRRVLYLRDQLKDLATAMTSAGSQVEVLENRVAAASARLATVRSEYDALAGSSPANQVSASAGAVSRDLARVSSGIAVMEELDGAREAHQRLRESKERLIATIRAHDDVHRERSARTDDLRQCMSRALAEWLAVLQTNNLGDVGLDQHFRVTIDGRPMTDQRGPSGSSRLRVVLAFHAAQLQAALENGGAHPGLLLLDAPKQHEIEPYHFGQYLEGLRALSERTSGGLQIVLSSRSDVNVQDGDVVWEPQHASDRPPPPRRFLGEARSA